MKGIIFDMGGTMVDNMMVHHRAWKVKLASLGLEMTLEEVMEKVHGVNVEILERLFGDRFTLEERIRISDEKEEEYRRIFLQDLKPIDGLMSFLNQLKAKGIPMAVGTAAPPENADFVMDNLQLRDYFEGVFHAKSVSKGKPDPEIFEKAAASMQLEAKDCLIFEDSLTGIETARRAGASAVVVTTTHKKEEFAKFPNVIKFIDNFVGLEIETLKQLVVE